jgi:N,N'-diacetyllegionaminate synthase
MSVKIIAEVGSNWRNFEDCKDSISKAKACGADAVKFQLFDYVSLYGPTLLPVEVTSNTYYLNKDWLPKLKEKADACGIEFMCTAFSPELIDIVDPFVSTHKVASSDLTHIRMLEKLEKIKKPVILSTGGSGKVDIATAVKIFLWREIPVTLMYCVSAYPARVINAFQFEWLKSFGCSVGYSDHSIDVAIIPLTFAKLGATVIEKHANFVGARGPDSPHSLNTEEFKCMVQTLRGEEPMLNEEQDMITMYNRRLIATRDISPGDVLIENGNFGIYRSLKPESVALSPWLVDKVNGQIAKIFIKCGDGISPDSF